MKRFALVAVLLPAAWVAAAQGLKVQADEPRAFGYQVGDLVTRRVSVDLPAGWVLDESSLPRPGGRGRSLELRRVSHQAAGGRHEITLEYQVMLAPAVVRTLEIASWRLRLQAGARTEEALVEAWPVTVAPLVQAEAPVRRGLGELQPDAPPPLRDLSRWQWRLQATVLAAVLVAGALAVAYLGPPWRAARNRPFGRAWRELHALPPQPDDARWQQACRALHDAINRTAGEVLFASRVDAFVAARPAYRALRDDLARFLDLSSRQFFGGAARGADDARWLVGLARRLRDAERGLA